MDPLTPEYLGARVLEWLHSVAAWHDEVDRLEAEEAARLRAAGYRIVTAHDLEDGREEIADQESGEVLATLPRRASVWEASWRHVDVVTDAAFERASAFPKAPYAWLNEDVSREDLATVICP